MSGDPRVLSLVWNLMRGGTEGQCARTAIQLAKLGLTHRVAVFRPEGFFLAEVEAHCGAVQVLDVRRMRSLRTIGLLRGFAHRLRRDGIELLHAWDMDAVLFGAMIARWAGIPFITSRRDLGEIYPAHKRRWAAWADRRAAGVVVNAHAIAAQARRNGLSPESLCCIPNILDLEEFDRLQGNPAPWLRPDALPVVAMVARLDPEKDVTSFLRALGRVRTPCRAVIAGDGCEREALEDLTRELGLAERVHFLGEVTEIPALYRHADVFALTPCRNEGLSNSILEGMAAGLPGVVTDCGGNAELVEDGVCGRVVAVGDVPTLATALDQVLTLPGHGSAWGAAGRQRVALRHAPGEVAGRFRALYRTVCGRAE